MVPKLTPAQKEATRQWVARLDASRARLVDEVEADLEPYRHLTAEQEARLRVGVVQAAWKMLQDQPDRQAILDYRDPPAPDFERVWRRLVAQGNALREQRAAQAR